MKTSFKIFLLLPIIGFSLLLFLTFSNPVLAQTENNDWVLPENLSKSGANTNPILLIDSDGGFHAIWQDTYDEEWVYSGGDGNTWSDPEIVSFPFPYENTLLKLIADSQGKIHAFWTDSENELYYSRVLVENFISLPSQWTTAQLLESSVVGIDIATDINNNVHLAIMRSENLKANITAGVYYKVYSNENATWSQITEIDNSSYLRIITTDESNIDIALSENTTGPDSIHIAWNNPSRARIFLSNSNDGGGTWDLPFEIVGPNSDFGVILPFDILIEANEDQLLAIWKVKDSGNNCSQEFKWSSDQGQTWSDQQVLFDQKNGCPEENHLHKTDNDEFLLFSITNSQPSFSAWNGSSWSNPQTQHDFASLIDPDTKRNLDLQCRETVFYRNSFYVIGCDRDLSNDIWITSRQIISTEKWFPSPSAWNTPETLTYPSQRISSIISVSDDSSIYLFWVQSSWSDISVEEQAIFYTRWDGDQWSTPTSIIEDMLGVPNQLSAAIDNQGRIFLTWINQNTGELLFSWANSDKANFYIEWAEPIILPSPSNIVSSPDILTDENGKILIVFAVPLNEDRGIYFVESLDTGETWSGPYNIVNAEKETWPSVDHPQLNLTSNGAMHLLFTQYSLENLKQIPQTLYYSQSNDGGVSWGPLEIVSEGYIQWSNLLCVDDTIHRIWQEKNDLVIFNNDQVSLDRGMTWAERTTILASNTVGSIAADVALSNNGVLHFVQLTNFENNFFLQDMSWDGIVWVSDGYTEVISQNAGSNFLQTSISAAITSNGDLNLAILSNNQSTLGKAQNKISTMNRVVAEPQPNQKPTIVKILPTESANTLVETPDLPEVEIKPTNIALETETLKQESTTTPYPSIENNLPAKPNRNFVGVIFISIIVVIVILVTVLWKIFSMRRD